MVREEWYGFQPGVPSVSQAVTPEVALAADRRGRRLELLPGVGTVSHLVVGVAFVP